MITRNDLDKRKVVKKYILLGIFSHNSLIILEVFFKNKMNSPRAETLTQKNVCNHFAKIRMKSP